jgi:hypothetical protein
LTEGDAYRRIAPVVIDMVAGEEGEGMSFRGFGEKINQY